MKMFFTNCAHEEELVNEKKRKEKMGNKVKGINKSL